MGSRRTKREKLERGLEKAKRRLRNKQDEGESSEGGTQEKRENKTMGAAKRIIGKRQKSASY